MAIVAFWSNEEKETGQSMSMVALSTYMAIERNYKILNVSTDFNEGTLESSYWNTSRIDNLVKTISKENEKTELESGVEGLTKIINSNKTTESIVANYTRVVLNTLDVLCAPKTKNYEEYLEIAELYPSILQVSNRSYDFVFVDVSKKMPKEQIKQILEMADIIIVNMTQRLKTIDSFMELREKNDFFSKNNIMLNIGRYDKFSKYNIKNISRYMKEKKDVNVTLYNTLFFESCSEGTVAEMFLRLRKIDPEDRNAVFIEEISRTTKDLIYKLQELQMRR